MATFRTTSAIIGTMLLGVAVPAALQANPILYGDFSGATVDFLDVTESSITDAVPLFGPPTVSVDSIDFDPVNFGALAVNGAADVTDGLLQMTIMSKPFFGITAIQLGEAGDYTLSGLPDAFAQASVNASVYVEITEVDTDSNGIGEPITPLQLNANMVFTPSGGTFSRPGDDGIAVIWTGSLDIDVAQMLIDEGVSGVATKVKLAIDNTLTAVAANNALAFIQKKDFGGLGVTVFVPEPSSIALGTMAFTGLGLVMASRRRRLFALRNE